MRAADAAEVYASDGLRPAQALRRSMKGSDFSRTLLIEGEPAAMFGVRVIEGVGFPWALTTETAERFPLAFWRASQHVVREIVDRYRFLSQCIDARHVMALRWAGRLGFRVDKQPHECGKFGLPFHMITLRAKGCDHA